jgi:hypothetical protein
MNAQGTLPDFRALIGTGATQLYAPFGPGPFVVLPTATRIATRQGQPILSLMFVRRPDQPGPTGNYAVLDVELTQDVPLDDALGVARAVVPSATVAPATMDLGFIRLIPGGAGVSLPTEMTMPVPLGWSAASGCRWTQRLDVDTGELIKGALLDGTALFGARVEFTIRGVAPRVAASGEFVPAALIAAVLAPANESTIALPQLIKRLLDPALPLTLTLNESVSRTDAITAMADRLLATYGRFVPATGPTDPPCFSFTGPLPVERLTWDLSQPAGAVRAFSLQLDPLSAVRGLANPASLIQEATIPPLDLGFREIVVTANLPPKRAGIPAVGVRISLPPDPPGRPSGINTTAIFTEPDDTARVTLRLGPDEPLDYTATPFAIVAAGAVVQQSDGMPRVASGNLLHLQASDFPLTFAHIIASERLAAQATVTGALTYSMGVRSATQPIMLGTGAADVSVAIPAGASEASVTLSAVAPCGVTADLPPQPPGIIRLDLASFSGYGPHRIPITCAFQGDAPALRLELQSEDSATQGTITLTPGSPTATWGYVAASPFHTGFKVRAVGGTWSAVLPPSRALCFNPDGSMPETSDPIEPFVIDGIDLSPSPDDATIFYIPAEPAPEVDTSGRPTLGVFKTAQATTLQLGTRLTLPADKLQALLRKVKAQYPRLGNVALQPAPIQVQKAALVLADTAGVPAELASSPTSAFPPYAAVFSLTLAPAQAAQAVSAMGGRTGVLFVDYTIVSQGAANPVVKRCDVATWFHGTDGLSHVHSFA